MSFHFRFKWTPRGVTAAVQSFLSLLALLFFSLPFFVRYATGELFNGYTVWFGSIGTSAVGVVTFASLLITILLPWVSCFIGDEFVDAVVCGAEGVFALFCAVGFFLASTTYALNAFAAPNVAPFIGSILCGVLMLAVCAGSVLSCFMSDR